MARKTATQVAPDFLDPLAPGEKRIDARIDTLARELKALRSQFEVMQSEFEAIKRDNIRQDSEILEGKLNIE